MLEATGALVDDTDGVSSSIGGKVSLATASVIFFFLGLCLSEVSLWSVSDLILDLIHSEIVIIDLIPRFHHL